MGLVYTADSPGGDEIDDCVVTVELTKGPKSYSIGNHLLLDQKQLLQLIEGYPAVFSDISGCYELVERIIRLTDPMPCTQTVHNIPISTPGQGLTNAGKAFQRLVNR